MIKNGIASFWHGVSSGAEQKEPSPASQLYYSQRSEPTLVDDEETKSQRGKPISSSGLSVIN